MVLVAVGRRPVTDTLNLAAAGLKTNEQRLHRGRRAAQDAVDGIYAIGDITGGPLLAHKAMKEGVVAAEVDRRRPCLGVRSGRDPELRLHRSRSRDRRTLRRGSEGRRIHDQGR